MKHRCVSVGDTRSVDDVARSVHEPCPADPVADYSLRYAIRARPASRCTQPNTPAVAICTHLLSRCLHLLSHMCPVVRQKILTVKRNLSSLKSPAKNQRLKVCLILVPS